MKNKWTTLVEDQTEKANEAISEILGNMNSDTGVSRKNKGIALGMAGIGVLLILFGIWPFISDSSFKADITDDSSNIFTDAEPVEVVDPASPGDEEVDFEALFGGDLEQGEDFTLLPVDETLALPDDAEAEIITLDDPLPVDVEDIVMPEEPMFDSPQNKDDPEVPTEPDPVTVVTPPEVSSPAYRENTHTGTVDPTPIVYGDNTSTKAVEAPMHAAAPSEMTDSGPEEWFAIFIALGVAFLLRRKKLFA